MPISPCQHLLCSYRYDALDRSIDWAPIGQAGIQRFHCKERLATEIQGSVKHSIFQHDDQVLAQKQHMDDKIDITLLTTDPQGSVLNALDAHRLHPIAYMPYGHRRPGNGLLSLLGFNGERPDPVTGHYHLGHGYRQFNPVLMRFNSPDSLSPFGKGGLNAYVYCGANPVNLIDPTGHDLKKIIELLNENIANTTKNSRMSHHTKKALELKEPENFASFKSARNQLMSMSFDPKYRKKNVEIFEAIKNGTSDQAASLMEKVRIELLDVDVNINILSDLHNGTLTDPKITSDVLEPLLKHRSELIESARRIRNLPAPKN